MKEKTAYQTWNEIEQERNITGGGWSASYEKEREEMHSRSYAYRDIWTVQIAFTKKQPKIRLPSDLLDVIAERDFSITLDLSGWIERRSQNPDYRTRFILDDGEFEKIEHSEEEQERLQLKREISGAFDVQRSVAESLSEHFDSVDEILTASREELTEVPGVGNSRANKILHRYSHKAKQRLEGRKSGIIVIPDEEGVLRLPEEFENDEHTPDYSSVSGKLKDILEE